MTIAGLPSSRTRQGILVSLAHSTCSHTLKLCVNGKSYDATESLKDWQQESVSRSKWEKNRRLKRNASHTEGIRIIYMCNDHVNNAKRDTRHFSYSLANIEFLKSTAVLLALKIITHYYAHLHVRFSVIFDTDSEFTTKLKICPNHVTRNYAGMLVLHTVRQ